MPTKRKESPIKSTTSEKKPRTAEKPSAEEQRRRAREWAEAMKQQKKEAARGDSEVPFKSPFKSTAASATSRKSVGSSKDAESAAAEPAKEISSRGRSASIATGKRASSSSSSSAIGSVKKKAKAAVSESEDDSSEEAAAVEDNAAEETATAPPAAATSVATPKRKSASVKQMANRIPTPKLEPSVKSASKSSSKSSRVSSTTPRQTRTPQIKRERVLSSAPYSNEAVPPHLLANPVEANLKAADLSPDNVLRPLGASYQHVKPSAAGKHAAQSLSHRIMSFVSVLILAVVSYFDLQIGVTAIVVLVVFSAFRRLLAMIFSPRAEFIRDTEEAIF